MTAAVALVVVGVVAHQANQIATNLDQAIEDRIDRKLAPQGIRLPESTKKKMADLCVLAARSGRSIIRSARR